MNGHEHHDHDHDHKHEAAETLDAGSQALSEALGSSFTIVKIVMWLMLFAFLCSGFFQVGPQEKAVILRFGKPVGEGEKALKGAGLHWSLPYPIDEIVRIPITQIQTVKSDNGWYFVTPEEELSGESPSSGMNLNPAIDGSLLTSDTNIIHARAALAYHIADPLRYAFDFANASNAVRSALDNALLDTAARFSADDALINAQAQFLDAVQERATALVEEENLGIVVDYCTVESKAPRQLADIFNQVTIAREQRAQALNDAYSYANQVTNTAIASAASIINQAQSAKFNYVTNLVASARKFEDILPYYKQNPSLYVQQTFVQMVGSSLTNVDSKWYVPQRADGKPRELRLMLNREPPGTNAAGF
ncbi:MAG TPA: protease modulator HflK [Verrucomicrobiae bacterium]|jgi:regulator of protease activity HflC (stomatin/prohibitin superfamily)|nr:protease modulator HflK [Verrucomicrobiae bacterium]